MTSLKDRLDEAFKEWVWDAEAAKIVVNEKPTHVIFKRDLPRFKAQLIALFQQEVMAALPEKYDIEAQYEITNEHDAIKLPAKSKDAQDFVTKLSAHIGYNQAISDMESRLKERLEQ